ncbi:ribonuclease H-like domain-containing protein [Tanacetum coccineum]
MSNNNNLQTNTSSALHNAIMEAGGKDRPPMLAPGNYNEPYEYKSIPNPEPVTPGNDGFTSTRQARVMDANVSEHIKKNIDAEAEAVQIILIGIANDIYSTVDACLNANKCRKQLKATPDEVNEIRAERLARNANPLALVAATHQPFYHPQPKPTHYTQSSTTRSQAATRNKGKEIANIPPLIYDLEPEAVSDEEATPMDKEIEKLMALISMSFKKIYKPANNNLRTSSNTRNKNVDNTPRSDRRIGYDRQTGKYENERAVNVVGARENVGTQIVRKIRIQCFNCKELGHVARECKKAKRVYYDEGLNHNLFSVG